VLAWPEREIYPSVRRSFVELRVDEWKGKILRFPAALNPVRRLTLLPEMYRSMTAIGRNAVWLDFADRRRLHPGGWWMFLFARSGVALEDRDRPAYKTPAHSCKERASITRFGRGRVSLSSAGKFARFKRPQE
jgi:hypothetical protein